MSSVFLAFMGTHSKGYIYGKKSSKRLTAIISSLPLFFLSVFRYGIGTDYFNYVEIYNLWIPRGTRVSIEPLFYYLNRAIHYFAGNDYRWLFVVLSIVYIGFTFIAIYKMSDSPVLSIYLLVAMTFYLSSFNTTREHIGCSILLLSVYYAEKRDLKRFLLLVALATGFHYTCIVFAFVYLFAKYMLNPKKVIAWTVVFIVLQGPIIILLSRLLSSSFRYSRYLISTTGFSLNNVLGLLIQVLLLLFALYLHKYNDGDVKYNLFLGCQTLAVWVNILSMSISALARMKWIFTMPAIIFVPLLIRSIPYDGSRKMVAALVCIAYFVYATIMVGVLHSYGIIPYVSLFQMN